MRPNERRPKRVLLTGATGFVGQHLHRALLARGYAVRAICRTPSQDRLIDTSDTVLVDDAFAQSTAWWVEACASVDTVVHAAWYVEPRTYLAASDNCDCLTGSLALARGALQAGVSHFIGIGTCFEYRQSSEPLRADSPIEPLTLYAASKAALWLMLQNLSREGGMRMSWARLFYLYGDGEAAGRLVPCLRQQLSRGLPADLSAGTQIRDFLDVREAADMVAEIVTRGQLGAINICSGKATTIRHLAEQVADEYGRRDLLRFGIIAQRPTDTPAVVGHCNLIRSEGADI